MAKQIFLIRHGETEANKRRIHQNSDEGLTPKGKLQAHHVCHFLEGKKIDTILCSPYVRARQTAEIISQQLGVPYMLSDSLVEIRRPDFVYGQGYYSLHTVLYLWRLFIYREKPSWDYDGAENMFMLRNRIADLKKTIENAPGESIAIVSHDVFINLFLEHACREKRITFRQFVHTILMTKKTPNTGIAHIQFDENTTHKVCPWQFVEYINPSRQ